MSQNGLYMSCVKLFILSVLFFNTSKTWSQSLNQFAASNPTIVSSVLNGISANPQSKVYTFDTSYNALFARFQAAIDGVEGNYLAYLRSDPLKYPYLATVNSGGTYNSGEYPLGRPVNTNLKELDFVKDLKMQPIYYSDKKNGNTQINLFIDVLRNGGASSIPQSFFKPLVSIMPGGDSVYVKACGILPTVHVKLRPQTITYNYASMDTINCTTGYWGWIPYPKCSTTTKYFSLDISINDGSFFLGTSTVCPLLKIDARTKQTTLISQDVYPGLVFASVPTIYSSGNDLISSLLAAPLNFVGYVVPTFVNLGLAITSLNFNIDSIINSVTYANNPFYKLALNGMLAPAMGFATDPEPFKNVLASTITLGSNGQFPGGLIRGIYPFYTPSNYGMCNNTLRTAQAALLNPDLEMLRFAAMLPSNPFLPQPLAPFVWKYFSQNPINDSFGCRIRSYVLVDIVNDEIGAIDGFIRCHLKNHEARLNYLDKNIKSCLAENLQFSQKLKMMHNLSSTITSRTYYIPSGSFYNRTTVPINVSTCNFNTASTSNYLNLFKTQLGPDVSNEINAICNQNAVATQYL